MEPAYPAVPLTTRVMTAGFDRSSGVGHVLGAVLAGVDGVVACGR